MYATASTEPLDIIRTNECEASPGLATSRFQACFNEIERLHAAIKLAHDALTKLSLTAEECVHDATGVLARHLSTST